MTSQALMITAMLRYSATAVAYVADYGTPGRVDMGNVGLTALVASPIPVSVLLQNVGVGFKGSRPRRARYYPCNVHAHRFNCLQVHARSILPGVILVGRWSVDPVAFPQCQKCKTGDLIPLSDFGSQGAAIHYKAWVCTNPDCGFNLKIRNGDVYINEPISTGSAHVARMR